MSFDEDIGLCRYDVNAPKPSAGFEDDLHSRGRWIRHRDERQQGSFQHATQSVLAEIARVVAQIGAFVGVVAGFWHILWIGVGLLVTAIVGWPFSRQATRAWIGIRSLLPRKAKNPESAAGYTLGSLKM